MSVPKELQRDAPTITFAELIPRLRNFSSVLYNPNILYVSVLLDVLLGNFLTYQWN